VNAVVQASLAGKDTFKRALTLLAHRGREGEQQIIAAFPHLSEGHRVQAIVALGDASGSLGGAWLRELLHSPEIAAGERPAALIALVKRQGVQCSDVLVEWVRQAARPEQGAALIGLACAGDDRAWDVVFSLLNDLLGSARGGEFGPPPQALSVNSLPAIAVCYLARHLSPAGDERQASLVRLIRARWAAFNRTEREWLVEQWPSVAPEGPDPDQIAAPDPDALASWAAHPILKAVY
jgi:hypothetical protein